MANWNGLILTDKGRALQAKVEAGQTLLTLTKFKLGNGVISGGQTLERLTDLVSPKQIIGINTCVPSENGLCTITGVVVNTGLTTGYELKELGVFATDPDLGEILYAITIDNHPDYLQAEGGATVVSEEFNLNIAISNTSNVTAVINTAGLATIGNINTLISEHNLDENSHQDLRTKIVAKINEHNTNKDAHQNGIKGNAATATKLQTARKINGVNFDGTADITITDDTKQDYYSGTIKIEGNASKFYPVAFYCSNGNDGKPFRVNIRRQKDMDAQDKGYLDFEMGGCSSSWGSTPPNIHTRYYSNVDFVADAKPASRSNIMHVWLKGGGITYYWGSTHPIFSSDIATTDSIVIQNDTLTPKTVCTLPKGVSINGVNVATTNQVVRTDADSVMDNSSTPKVIHGSTGKDWGFSWNPVALIAYDWTNSRAIWNYNPSTSHLALMPTSGIVTSPTPDSTDNSTKVATTAFVQTVSKANSTGIVASSLGETGWIKFANGLIRQWGTVSIGPTATATITLPITYAAGIYNINTTLNRLSGGRGDKQDWTGATVASLQSIKIFNGLEEGGTSTIFWETLGV